MRNFGRRLLLMLGCSRVSTATNATNNIENVVFVYRRSDYLIVYSLTVLRDCIEHTMEVDSEIDSQLLQQFSSLSTKDKEVLIAEFQGLLGDQLNAAGCAFYLDMNNWCALAIYLLR